MGTPSAEGARIEVARLRRVGPGEGVSPSSVGEGSVPPPQKIF